MIKPVLRVLCLGILSGVLFGCGGDNAQIAEPPIVIDVQDPIDPGACTSIHEPVCSVELKNIQCVTGPCPIGAHKTFPNRCESDAATARFLAEGTCGDEEGQPYFEEPVACGQVRQPVCGVVSTTEPCQTVPCPAMVRRSFDNQCEARAAQAFIASMNSCSSGPVVGSLAAACLAFFAPVCAKVNAKTSCTTQPCLTHKYETYGNDCEAWRELANVALNQACGELKGVLTSGEPPVRVDYDFPDVIKAVTVSDVAFVGDLLTLTLNYGGCDAQYFDLYVSRRFLEGDPVQVQTRFKPMVEDTCKALITSKATYDLVPLKYAYQQAYKTEHGEILLQGIGSYVF